LAQSPEHNPTAGATAANGKGGQAMTLPPRQINRVDPPQTIFERMWRDLHATQAEADVMGNAELRREAYAMVIAALKRLGKE
jgi:hypothetical protein